MFVDKAIMASDLGAAIVGCMLVCFNFIYFSQLK